LFSDASSQSGKKKPATASRVRGRLEAILASAIARGERAGPNPAQWRNHLDTLLPSKTKVRATKHHAALSYVEIGTFMAELRAQTSIAARALELLIVTAACSGEVLGAQWDEIDLSARVWTIPGARMKAGKPHRVPLSAPAVAVLEGLAPIRTDPFVFSGHRPNRPLSQMAMLLLMRRMGYGKYTVHGFRSSFRDWAGEVTSFPREIAEAALAHTVGDAVERAYRRGDALEKRRKLMAAWGEFCEPKTSSGKVVRLMAGA
jgi:integrase